MPATSSPEGRLTAGLRELGCSGRSFVEIARALGAGIGHGPFSEALSGKKSFDRATGEKLLAVLNELKAVRDYFPDVPINWAASDRVSRLVVLRRVERVAAELDRESNSAADNQ